MTNNPCGDVPVPAGTGKAAGDAWERNWQEQNRRLTVRNARVLALIAMVLVPLCTLLDYFAYPNLWGFFFVVRAVVAGIEIGLLAYSYTAHAERHYRMLMLLVPLVPAVSIAWMIYCSGDPASPYYAGLTLCLVGIGFLFQWGVVESVIAVLITLLIYLSATVPLLWSVQVTRESIGEFVNNGIFILANSMVIISGSLLHYRIRRNEAMLRFNLAASQKELEEKNAKLVELDEAKTSFFSNITHELRTPLTLMLAPLQSLLRRHPVKRPGENGSGPGIGPEISGIYHSALRLLKLINDLLDLASVDAGRMRIVHQRFPLGQFLERMADSVSNVARQGGIELKLESNVQTLEVEADQEKLEKILLNLLFNAVKFTPHGGTVILRARLSLEELGFEVADTGPGIAEEDLSRIFERFWQADSSVTKQHPGTGIGLALVNDLVKQMGGNVRPVSVLGEGTTMKVILPVIRSGDRVVLGTPPDEMTGSGTSSGPTMTIEPAECTVEPAEDAGEESTSSAWITSVYREAERAQAMRSVERNHNGATHPHVEMADTVDRSNLPMILIADDEEGIRGFMRSELEANFRIVEAVDGRQALEIARLQRPDLVIVDYMMPLVDGFAVCRGLRESPVTRLLPVMLVTARTDEKVRIAALRNGANDVLVKPFSLTEFHTRVQNLVQAGLLQREVAVRNDELENTLAQLRAAENELIQTEKMAALGVLTGGIMHEINNPLNFTRSALYVLDRRAAKLPDGSGGAIGEVVADLREGLDRIATIVSDLRFFCHPETAVAGSCSALEPVQSAVRLLVGPFKSSGVAFDDSGIPPGLKVRGDANQMTLVLLNLIKNAIDALSTDKSERTDPPGIWVSAAADGCGEVRIHVRDNGPGIEKANLGKVFDPFFTTKPPGEGTGLGLSICYRIVAAHGGRLEVDSQMGVGTTFTICLREGDASNGVEEKVKEPVLSA